ncbi:BGTF surface domain-containing protein [Halorussus sp. AFM4]|uniref:BGTF surface domain-containing protein n=1 Tax=Halorussus sp. AFM4 TaxID=3421651 RepID=UPI003EB9B90F
MSARLPRLRAAGLVTLLLAAAVAPAVGASSAAAGAGSTAASAGASASFSPTVTYGVQGDITTITVETSDGGVVNIGSQSEAFWMQVRVGNGKTELTLNTYLAGVADTEAEMKRALSGGTVVRATPTPVDKPLEAAIYDLNVTRDGRELALGKLVLNERATNGIDVRIAPASLKVSELDTEKKIVGATRAPWGNNSVARGDWLAVHVNATGLAGLFANGGVGGANGVDLRFAQVDGDMNADRNEFDGGDVERFVSVEQGFYVFVDTGEHDIEAGDRYNVSFTIEADTGLAKRKQVVTTSFRVAPRKVHIERNGPGDRVVVEGKATISGTTTLTPGSTINITVRDDGMPPFHQSRTVRVTAERTFETTVDFSDLRPGRTFDIRLVDQGRTVPGMVKPEETTTAAPNTTTATTTTTTVPTTTTTATATTTTTATITAEGLTQAAAPGGERPLRQQAVRETGESSGGPVPGFGPAAGVVAVVAATLLAARRR